MVRKKVKGKKIVGVKNDSKAMGIRKRTFDFAVRVVKPSQHLDERSGVGRTLGKQLLRAETSIGANVEEAQAGQSKADFISKNAIALKEARETNYWLRLLVAAEVLPVTRIAEIQTEAEELTRVIGAVIASAKRTK